MVIYGIEGIIKFDFARSRGNDCEDLYFSIAESFKDGLRKFGHKGFCYLETDCKERQFRERSRGGTDLVDAGNNTNLFFINTHGRNDKGIISLAFNTEQDALGTSSMNIVEGVPHRNWSLGDTCKWFFMASCATFDLKYILSLLPIFQGLHMLCGTYGSLNNFFTTDEIGDDLAENLTSKRQAVCDAWINSLEDWLTNNSPMIVAAEDRSSIDPITGRADWSSTTIFCDHLTGHGTTVPDIPNHDISWLSVKWKESYLIKERRYSL